MATAASLALVQKAYVAYYNRPADPLGQEYWASLVDSNGLQAVTAAFGASPEAKNLYGNLSSDAAVEALYVQMFGRASDAAGKKFYVDGLTAGKFTLASIAMDIAYGASGDDATVLANKITVANTFTSHLDTTSERVSYSGDAAAASARALIASVTKDAATVTAANANVDSVITAIGSGAGSTFTLTTDTDTVIGTAGNDTFTGLTAASGSTVTAGDLIVDQSTSDNDTLNLTLNAGLTTDLTVTNVENVNLNIASVGGVTSDATKLSGVKNLTVNMSNLTVGGATVVGNKVVTVSNVDASKIAAVTAGAGTTDVTVTQVTKAGAAINANTATGAIQVTGAGTVNASAATGAVTVTAIDTAASATFKENYKAVVVNADVAAGNVLVAAGAVNAVKFAGNVTVNAATTKSVVINNATDALTATGAQAGVVTVNAAKAETVIVDDAKWGATVNATSAHAASATVTVKGITSNGATLTLGSGSAAGAATTNTLTVNLQGTAGTTDKATVSASGTVALDVAGATGAVDAVTLSGNGADVIYNVTATNSEATSFIGAGSYAVTLAGDDARFSAKTVSGVSNLKITANAASAAVDLSKVSATGIEIAADMAGDAITVANGANITLSANQTTELELITATAGDAITINVGDTNGAANTAVPTFTTTTLTLGGIAGSATANGSVTLNANTGKVSVTTTTLTANNNLTVAGTKDVDLGTLSAAKSLNAAGLSGVLTVTAAGANTAATITSGSGADSITLNEAKAFSVNAGDGNNTVTLTSAAANTVIVTGSGDDSIANLGAANSNGTMVLTLGAGNDTVALAGATDAIIGFGDGTTDQLTVGANADETAKANFAISGVEKVVFGGAYTLTQTAAQFAQDNTFALTGDTGTLAIVGNVNAAGTGVASVIDASGVTRASGVLTAVSIAGSSKADTITGSAGADTIKATAGADSIDGGAGVNTYDASNLGNLGGATVNLEGASAGAQKGIVINLGSTAITASSVQTATGLVLADSISSVAAGTTAYEYTSSASTNSAVQQNLANIQNVVGTSGADYIAVGSAGSTVTAGVGTDYIKLGGGADTVKLTLSTDSGDTVSGFTSATDVISFATAGLVNGTPVSTLTTLADVAAFVAGSTAIGANDRFVEITASQAAGGVDTAAEVAALLSTGATAMTNIASGDKIVIALDDGTDTYLWYWQDSATNTGKVDAAELSLAVKLVGVTDIANGDLAVF